jgi:hypothetical protein
MNDKKVFGSLRVVAGCALVGAILFGAFLAGLMCLVTFAPMAH